MKRQVGEAAASGFSACWLLTRLRPVYPQIPSVWYGSAPWAAIPGWRGRGQRANIHHINIRTRLCNILT